MATVIPEDYAGVAHLLQYTGDAEIMVITYGVAVDQADLPPDATDLAGSLGGAFETEVMPLVSEDITLTGTEVTWQSTAPPNPPLLGFAPSSTDGGAAGALIPQNSAFLVHKRSSSGGRGGRGRCYIPGVQEGNVDAIGQVAGATVTAWNAALEDWRLAIIAASYVSFMVILHNDPGAFAAATPNPVNAITLDPVIATQRRRLRR